MTKRPTKIVNINKQTLREAGYSDLEEWLKHPDHVYIGRAVRYVQGARQSKWANPFSLKKYGRDSCIDRYADYIMTRGDLLAQLSELEGKVLGCWCKPERCHGDVLIELLSGQ
ncbi:MAG: DUF4326 domain-containing protein [Saprospiraceae bacterium]|nr:DUF4326 domain-containing protein [Saprospiraceae bacterium]